MTRFQFVLYNRVLKHFSLEFVLPPKLELREKSLKYIRFRTILTISSLYKLFSAYKAGNTHNDCRESIISLFIQDQNQWNFMPCLFKKSKHPLLIFVVYKRSILWCFESHLIIALLKKHHIVKDKKILLDNVSYMSKKIFP